ncbi:S-adenosyl-L-methionine-dependent methyltransferase [Dichotomocladium elegans]|nr:S-adenosyl-L-methionine-dependent methyltransferase [Dichotomocladium elegans]
MSKEQTQDGHVRDCSPGEIENIYDNGRRYLNRTDVAHVLPNDERDDDRAHVQHWIIKIAFNGNFSAPITDELNRGIIVQDAGCGAGTWTLEMASDFPQSTFIGTDLSPRFPEAVKPRNSQFRIHNLLDEGSTPENYFNYIHQRLLILSLFKNDWEKTIREHVRTLAPGGWLECMEIPFYRADNPGPNHAVLVKAWNMMCESKGLYLEIPDHLEAMFARAGLVNIGRKDVGIPMNHHTQKGKLGWEDFRESFLALKPHIGKAIPELDNDARYNEFLQDCLKEATELCTRYIFTRVWGQKPLRIEEPH